MDIITEERDWNKNAEVIISGVAITKQYLWVDRGLQIRIPMGKIWKVWEENKGWRVYTVEYQDGRKIRAGVSGFFRGEVEWVDAHAVERVGEGAREKRKLTCEVDSDKKNERTIYHY